MSINTHSALVTASKPENIHSLEQILATAFSVLLFSGSFWFLNTRTPYWTSQYLVCGLMVTCLLMVPQYLLLRRLNTPVISWKWGCAVVAGLCLLTPSFLQTDQLRYLWDGLQIFHGNNPFATAPAEGAKWGVVPFWHGHINHPELPTVYPPFAQFCFWLATVLNPMTYFGDPGFLFLWPAELGWRIVVAISSILLICGLKFRRWDLVVFHPLFLLTVIANLHVDILALAAFAWILRPEILTHRLLSHCVVFALGVLARWTPLVIVFPLFLQLKKKHGNNGAFVYLLLCTSIIIFSILWFWTGAQGNFFASSQTYASQWYFFGFLHRWIADVLSYWTPQSIQYSKFICGGLFAIVYVAVLKKLWQRKVGFQMAVYLIYAAFLTSFPTLHPWYLLPLLVLGLPFTKVFWSAWIWPLLAPLSYTFYLSQSDVPAVRTSTYTVVGMCLVRDFYLALRRA